jgi:hypothetical protein
MFAEPVECLFKTSQDSENTLCAGSPIYEYRLEPEGIKVCMSHFLGAPPGLACGGKGLSSIYPLSLARPCLLVLIKWSTNIIPGLGESSAVLSAQQGLVSWTAVSRNLPELLVDMLLSVLWINLSRYVSDWSDLYDGR